MLVGYELELSRQLKYGADIWLNNPVVTREASGTSGMTAAMTPLPVLGVPGWWPENENFSFYDDSFVFRPRR